MVIMQSCASRKNARHYMNSRILGFWGVNKWLSCNHAVVQGIQDIT